MKFNDDYHYITEISNKMIEKGLANLDLHSIRLNTHLTEEQMQENSTAADLLTREEWSMRCSDFEALQNKKLEKIIDLLSKHFVIYQYKDKNISYCNRNNQTNQNGYEWDLYCNFGSGRDARLSFNNHGKTLSQRYEDLNKIKELLKGYEENSIMINIQYTQTFHEEELKETAQNVYFKIKDKFITFSGMTGKIKPVTEYNDNYFGTNCQYGFFKKGSKNKFYQVTNMVVSELA